MSLKFITIAAALVVAPAAFAQDAGSAPECSPVSEGW